MHADHYTQLRQQVRKQRKNLSKTMQLENSLKIYHQLKQLKIFQQALSIAMYYPSDGEPDLFSLMTSEKKQLLLPIVSKNKNLQFFPFHRNDTLTINRYGILEPSLQENEVLPQTIDIIIMPLVVFDDAGNRLGRGAGYYDRTLSFLHQHPRSKIPYLIGVGYEFQKVTALEPRPWDIELNMVITENKIYKDICA